MKESVKDTLGVALDFVTLLVILFVILIFI